ncbi:uncharacterized protein [Drosophila bipectinata]|uniref:uncharacterized protein n=1 Tax=Drosophila bipectinata TaxID=42026 RepID=UPI001C8A3571|nr:uncharacterized protein LOC108126184 [Drosophila bipectinata]
MFSKFVTRYRSLLRNCSPLLTGRCTYYNVCSQIQKPFETREGPLPQLLGRPVFVNQKRFMPMEIIIVVHDDTRFYIDVHGKEAELSYRIKNGVMTIFHTRVPKELGGLGLGKNLAKAALDFAMSNAYFLDIRCGFVLDYLNKYKPHYARYLIQ